ncbi:hypothetical protein [Kurthia massiliensis]|uniref:hypothetical protein n=1 Tax=Kurthia massiliensis TaxID=1033739 RepID=UPI00028922C9|nr:hypothetical protein [Kurthia massiliensis]
MTFIHYIEQMQYLVQHIHKARQQLRQQYGEQYLTTQSWYALQQYEAAIEKAEQLFDFCFELVLLHDEIDDAHSQHIIYRSIHARMESFIGYVQFQQQLMDVWQQSDALTSILDIGERVMQVLHEASDACTTYLLKNDDADDVSFN